MIENIPPGAPLVFQESTLLPIAELPANPTTIPFVAPARRYPLSRTCQSCLINLAALLLPLFDFSSPRDARRSFTPSHIPPDKFLPACIGSDLRRKFTNTCWVRA